MDRLEKFWEELKKRNVVRAFLFYVVSAWLIIQFATATFPYFDLPTWSIKAVIVTLLVGAPIVLIVSWIYEMTTDGLKKTDSVDHEKSITIETGKKLNRLTISILSLAVVFLLVDKFYLSKAGPAETERTESIAVFPFSIQGSADIQYLKDGMVDLISSKLDAMPGLNATDPNIILGVSNTTGLDNRNPVAAAEAAEDLGANRVILGSITQIGDLLEVKISKYDNAGRPVGNAIIEDGTAAELYSRVDNIIKRLVADELDEQGSEFASEAVLTTNKLESIVPFLQGIQLSRAGKSEEALAAMKESIEADSTFTLGYYRYIEIAGWIGDVHGAIGRRRQSEYDPYFNKLETMGVDLGGKMGELVRAKVAYLNSDMRSENLYRGLLKKYGESVEIINGLAESIFHHREIVAGDKSDAKPYFERLLELDPTNDEYLTHIIDIAENEGDLTAFETYASKLNAESARQNRLLWRKLMLQDSISDAEIIELSKSLDPKIIQLADHKIDLFRGFDQFKRISEIDNRFAWVNAWIDKYGRRIGGEHEDYFQEKFAEFDKFGNVSASVFLFVSLSSIDEIPIMSTYGKVLRPKVEATLGLANTYDPDAPKLEIQYALGLLHLFEGNEEEASEFLKSIRVHFNNSALTSWGKARDQARLLYYNFAGIRDYMHDDFERAKINFDSAVNEVERVNMTYANALAKARNFHIAQMHIKNEEFQEALEIYKNTLESMPFGVSPSTSTWGFNVYRIAQMNDQLGNNMEAIGYYKKFLEAFNDPDDMYKPWVDDAYRRLSNLVNRPEQELRGEITDIDP